MFFIIRPKKSVGLELTKIPKLAKKSVALKYNSHLSQFEIYWNQKGVTPQLIGSLTPFLKTKGGQVLFDFLSFEFFAKNIPFIKYETIFREMLELFSEVMGTFVVIDLFTDKEYSSSLDQEDLVLILNESRQEGVKNINEFLAKELSVDTLEEIISDIQSASIGFGVYKLAIFISTLSEKEVLSKEVANKLFEKAIDLADQEKSKLKKTYFIFKFVQFYKFIARSNLQFVSKDFLVRTILPFFTKHDVQSEVIQFLIFDAITELYSQSFDEVTEVGTQILEEFLADSPNYLFSIELNTFSQMMKTGNPKEAFLAYVNGHKNKRLIQLRDNYEKIYAYDSFFKAYYNNVILWGYYRKLPLLMQIRYEYFLFKKRIKYPNKIANWLLVVWLFSVIVIVILALLFP